MKIKRSKDEVIFDTINYALSFLVMIVILYPLIYIISASFSDPFAVAGGEMLLWPVRPSLDGYKKIIEYKAIWRGYANTLVYMVVGTLINVVMTLMLAYPLSSRDFRYKKFFTKFVLITMYFSGGMIPTYILMDRLHIMNTMWALVLPGAISVNNMIIMKSYFQFNIPYELKECAKLEGCSELRYLNQIVIPLSKSILAVIALYYAVAHWNEYFKALLYMVDEEKFPLQMVLRQILILSDMDVSTLDDIESFIDKHKTAEMIKYGVVIVSTLPFLCIYPFIQKFFVHGVMAGSVKG